MRLSFLLLLFRLSLGLKYEDIKASMTTEYGPEGNGWRVRDHGPVNLHLAHMAHKLGLDYNLRMLSPDMEVCYKDKNEKYFRECRKDVGKGALEKMLCRLFPSNGGKISISSNASDCFARVIAMGSRSDGVRFMAMLMAGTLGKDVKYVKKSKRHMKVVCGAQEVHFQGENIDGYSRILEKTVIPAVKFFSAQDENLKASTPYAGINAFLQSRKLLLHAFLYHYIETKEEVDLFYNTLLDIISDDNKMLDQCFIRPDEDDSRDYTLVEHVNEVLRGFPYSQLNPAPSNSVIRAFSRKKREFLTATFSDCVEVSMMGFVCCMLFDEEKRGYMISRSLTNVSPNLVEFFQGYSQPFAVDTKSREDWSKVVGDLDNENVIYSKIAMNGEVGTRFDLKAGLFNFLTVMRDVFGLQDRVRSSMIDVKRMGDDVPDNNLLVSEEFQRVLEEIVEQIRPDGMNGVEIKCPGVVAQKLSNGTWDGFGCVKISFSLKNDLKATVDLEAFQGHMSLKVNANFGEVLPESNAAMNKLLASTDVLDILIWNYASKLSPKHFDMLHEIAKTSSRGVFLSGSLDADESKDVALNVLYNLWTDRKKLLDLLMGGKSNPTDVERIKRSIADAENIMYNIIANSRLSDRGEIQNNSILFFINERFMRSFAGFIPADEKAFDLHFAMCHGVDDPQATCSYFKDNYDDIFSCDQDQIRLLIESIVANNRKDMIKVVAKKNNPVSNVHMFVGVVGCISRGNYPLAMEFLDRISVEDIVKTRSKKPLAVNARVFLGMLGFNGHASRDNLKKIYALYFYEPSLGIYKSAITPLLDETRNLKVLPVDFICECITKCITPSPNMADFYEEFLILIVRKGVRNEAFRVTRSALFVIKHMVGMYRQNPKSDTYELNRVTRYIKDIEQLDLVVGPSFDEAHFGEVIDGYFEVMRNLKKAHAPKSTELHDIYVSYVNSNVLLK